MKKIITIIAVILIMLTMLIATIILIATTLPVSDTEPKAKKSISEIYTVINETVILPEMSENMSQENLELKYGLNLEGIDNYLYVHAKVSPKQDTIAIFHVTDTKYVASLKETLQNIQTQSMNSMQNYEATQYEIAKNGKITVKENYVIFVMSEDVDTIVNKILENI